jgi:hypothetical protein
MVARREEASSHVMLIGHSSARLGTLDDVNIVTNVLARPWDDVFHIQDVSQELGLHILYIENLSNYQRQIHESE